MSGPLGALREQWVLVHGQPIFYRVSVDATPPAAAPFVLTPGFALSGRSLLPTALRLAPHHPTYVPDLPGFGRSPKPDHSLTIPELADALAAWMDAVGLTRAVLLGNSTGCQVIAEFAHRHPSMIERAVLTDPPGDPQARGLRQRVWRTLRDGFYEPFPLIRIAVFDYLRFGLWRALNLLQSIHHYPMDDRVQRSSVPTLLVSGGLNPVLPENRAKWGYALLKCGRSIVLPGVGSAVTFAAPEHLVSEVLAFMATDPSELRQANPDAMSAVAGGASDVNRS